MRNMWILLIVSVASAALAQTPAEPKFSPVQATRAALTTVVLKLNDPEVDASRIKPYKVQWKETFVTPLNQVIPNGTWTDVVERTSIDGKEVLKRTVTVDRPQRGIHASTVLIVNGKTFAPVTTEEVEPGKTPDLHFDFAGTHIAGNRKTRKIDATVETAAFDTLGGMTDLVPATLPLRPGYTARFPNFSATISENDDPASITWITLQVKRQDIVALPDGRRVKAWLVDSDTPLGFYKVWIAEEPPYIVRSIWMGPGGGRSTFDLISIG